MKVLLADDEGLIRSDLIGIRENSGDADELPGGLDLNYDVEAEDFSLKGIVKGVVDKVEAQVMGDVLQKTGGNKSKAARMLQIDYKTMHYKLKEYGLNVK